MIWVQGGWAGISSSLSLKVRPYTCSKGGEEINKEIESKKRGKTQGAQ